MDDAGELVCGVSTQAGASKGDDVTGGMKLKLATAINVVVSHSFIYKHTSISGLFISTPPHAFVPEEMSCHWSL